MVEWPNGEKSLFIPSYFYFFPAFRITHPALRTPHYAPRIPHYAHPALRTPHPALCLLCPEHSRRGLYQHSLKFIFSYHYVCTLILNNLRNMLFVTLPIHYYQHTSPIFLLFLPPSPEFLS